MKITIKNQSGGFQPEKIDWSKDQVIHSIKIKDQEGLLKSSKWLNFQLWLTGESVNIENTKTSKIFCFTQVQNPLTSNHITSFPLEKQSFESLQAIALFLFQKIQAERDLNEYLLSNQVKVTEPQIWNGYTFQSWLDDVVLFMKRVKIGSAKEQLITAKNAVEKLLDEDARKTNNAIEAIKELNILSDMF